MQNTTTCGECGSALPVRTLPSGREATEWHDCPALPPITDEDSARLTALSNRLFYLAAKYDCGEGG
jgi:hypothetical protein